MAVTGAIEITAYGRDVFATCGSTQPIPEHPAFDLPARRPLVIDDALRHPMLASPVPAPPPVGPGERLVAFLGRDPAFQAPDPADGSPQILYRPAMNTGLGSGLY